jgi:predicted amidohydrolase YtcJ
MSEIDHPILIRNARAYLFDQANSTTDTILIEAGRIAAVGDGCVYCSRAAAQIEVWDAHGATVLPGLIDTHPHLLHFATRYARLVDITTAVSHEDILCWIAQPSDILWQSRPGTRTFPVRSCSIPWRCGNWRSPATCRGGEFAYQLWRKIPLVIDSELMLDATRRAVASHHRLGVTAICENHMMYKHHIETYRRLRESGELNMRVAVSQEADSFGTAWSRPRKLDQLMRGLSHAEQIRHGRRDSEIEPRIAPHLLGFDEGAMDEDPSQ